MSKCKIRFFEMHLKSIFDGVKIVLHLEEKLKMSKEEETKFILFAAIVIWITKNYIIRQNAREVLNPILKLIKYTMIIQCLRSMQETRTLDIALGTLLPLLL